MVAVARVVLFFSSAMLILKLMFSWSKLCKHQARIPNWRGRSPAAVPQSMFAVRRATAGFHSMFAVRRATAAGARCACPRSLSSVTVEKYTERQNKLGRPVSPHVTTYAFPVVAASSITQRVTGVLLSVGVGGVAGGALAGVDVAAIAAAVGASGAAAPAKFTVAFPLARAAAPDAGGSGPPRRARGAARPSPIARRTSGSGSPRRSPGARARARRAARPPRRAGLPLPRRRAPHALGPQPREDAQQQGRGAVLLPPHRLLRGRGRGPRGRVVQVTRA